MTVLPQLFECEKLMGLTASNTGQITNLYVSSYHAHWPKVKRGRADRTATKHIEILSKLDISSPPTHRFFFSFFFYQFYFSKGKLNRTGQRWGVESLILAAKVSDDTLLQSILGVQLFDANWNCSFSCADPSSATFRYILRFFGRIRRLTQGFF